MQSVSILDNITEMIIGASFEVINELGSGFLEKVYENALCRELEQQRLKVDQQKKLDVWYKGSCVGQYRADLLVNNQIIVELKAVKHLEPINSAQVINYLKASNYPLGLLINFGNPRLEIRRLFNRNDRNQQDIQVRKDLC